MAARRAPSLSSSEPPGGDPASTAISSAHAATEEEEEDDEEADGPPPEWKRFALGAALTLAYVAGLAFAGFLIATPLFIAALCRLIGTRSLVRDAAVGVALAVAAWLMFVKVLAVGLP